MTHNPCFSWILLKLGCDFLWRHRDQSLVFISIIIEDYRHYHHSITFTQRILCQFLPCHSTSYSSKEPHEREKSDILDHFKFISTIVIVVMLQNQLEMTHKPWMICYLLLQIYWQFCSFYMRALELFRWCISLSGDTVSIISISHPQLQMAVICCKLNAIKSHSKGWEIFFRAENLQNNTIDSTSLTI